MTNRNFNRHYDAYLVNGQRASYGSHLTTEKMSKLFAEHKAILDRAKKLVGANYLKSILKLDTKTAVGEFWKERNDLPRYKTVTKKLLLEVWTEAKASADKWNESTKSRHRLKSYFMSDRYLKVSARLPKMFPHHPQDSVWYIPSLSVAQRFEMMFEGTAHAYLLRFIKTRTGRNTMDISRTTDPAKVQVVGESKQGDYIGVRGGFHQWETDTHTTAVLPHNWYSRVAKHGHVMIDGLFTLDLSSPLVIKDTTDGLEVRAARWLTHSTGSKVNNVSGYIAFLDNCTFHGKSVNSAITGVKRKVSVFEAEGLAKEAEKLAKKERKERTFKRINKAAKAHPDTIFTLEDSYKAGNCEWGTKEFCHRHNIDISNPETATTTFAELADIVKTDGRPELVSVLLLKTRQLERSR